jgi:hypothetical protein
MYDLNEYVLHDLIAYRINITIILTTYYDY